MRPSDTGGEIGEEASTKSGGLFNAEDWICRCGNINWAKGRGAFCATFENHFFIRFFLKKDFNLTFTS